MTFADNIEGELSKESTVKDYLTVKKVRGKKMTNMNYREYSALMSAVNGIMDGRTVSVQENSDWRSEVKTFGVNWACCGTQDIEESKKFAERINKACKIVEKLNAMQIIVNYEDEEKPDREAYKAMIAKYMEELQG